MSTVSCTPKRGMTQWLRMIERLSAEPAQAAYIQQLEQGRPVSAALWLSETSGFTHCLRTAAFCQTQSYKSKAVKQKAKRSGAPRGPSVPRCPPPRSSQAERQRREAEEALRLAEEEKRKEEKKKRDAVKERVKKCRQRLRSFHPAVKDHVVLEQLNEVCLQFSEEQLRELGNQIEETLKSSPLAAASIFHKAIESIGLTPMKVSEDTASTTSGPPTDSQEEAPSSEERRRAEENQAKMRIVEEQQAAEKARLAAERAEEKKKREEQRRKDAAAAEAARRQQEKKEELKAKKAEEKQKKQEEEEKVRKEQQRELAKQKAQEQAQKDRQAAQAEKEKLELERLINLFAKDRLDRLALVEGLSDEKLAASLQTDTESSSSLAGALQMLKAKLETCEDSDSDPLERAIALVSAAAGGRGVWPLALTAPAHLRLENALRNRVKKARNRLREAVGSFLKSSKLPNADQNAVTEWQRGMVDGTIELPPWSPQESEPKAAGTEKKKKEKEKPMEEDLDQILAEFDSSPSKSKKPGKKKKLRVVLPRLQPALLNSTRRIFCPWACRRSPLEGGFQPPNRLIHSNSAEAFDFDNENCKGQFLPLHRPTYDSRLNESGQYRYGEHFTGKKRLWELRLRLQFKRRLNQSDLFFAAELEEYVPLSAATKLAACARLSVIGFTTPLVILQRMREADEREAQLRELMLLEVVGERERPTIAMPLWTFDQFIETPEGETPPELTDPNLHALDSVQRPETLPSLYFAMVRRMATKGAKDCQGNVSHVDNAARPGPGAWGRRWQVGGAWHRPQASRSSRLCCGRPPLHLVLYTLEGAGEEKRHLQSRKTYFFRCGFWSSLKRPSKDVVTYFAGRSIELRRRALHSRRSSGNPAGSGLEIFGLTFSQSAAAAFEGSDRPKSAVGEIVAVAKSNEGRAIPKACPKSGVWAMPYEICVKNRQQNILLLTVEETDTIHDLKQDVKARVGEAEEPLFFNGVELLDEEATLLEYNIVPDECPGGPIVHLGGCAAFDLECELPSGRQIRESVTGDTTVAQLKGRITSEAGIPYLCMKLLAGDLELRDPVCLRHYDLAGRGLRVVTTRQLYAGPAV
eukprot:s721_g36.t3